MSRQAKNLSRKFERRSSELDAIRVKMESLFRNGALNAVEVEEVYSGLFLDIFTDFEALIESLFFGLVSRELQTVVNRINRKVIIRPSSMIRDVVLAGKQYLDWLPYNERTIKRANIFLQNGDPFSLLNIDPYRTDLQNYHLIRNALAHKSDNATKKFEKFIQELTLLPREKTPCGYLRSVPSGGQTQYEIAVVNLQLMANILCA